jgi:hypothetical protein
MDETRKTSLNEDVGRLMIDVKRRAERALGLIEQHRDLSWYSISAAARERGESPLAMWRVLRYWERRNPTLNTIARLADVLGVDVQWLLGGNIDSVVWKRNPRETMEVA